MIITVMMKIETILAKIVNYKQTHVHIKSKRLNIH